MRAVNNVGNIVAEPGLCKRLLDRLAKAYLHAICHNIDHHLSAYPTLPKTFLGHFILLLQPVAEQQVFWINERIAVDLLDSEPFILAEFYQFSAVFLFSQKRNMSFDRTLDLFKSLGHSCLTIDRERFITSLCALPHKLREVIMPVEHGCVKEMIFNSFRNLEAP